MSKEASESTENDARLPKATPRRQSDGRSNVGATRSNAKTPQTKKEQLIGILSRKTGADIEAISGRLGWQAHTALAAITRLRKAGYPVAVEKPGQGKPTRYRLMAELPPAADPARATTAPETINAG